MDLYKTYVGGFPDNASESPELYAESRAMVSTALVLNYYDPDMNRMAIAWERTFIERMKEEAKTNQFFDISFMAETSIQDEIERESKGDILPALLSYLLMLIYVTIGLGNWRFTKRFWVKAKFSLGFLGVVI